MEDDFYGFYGDKTGANSTKQEESYNMGSGGMIPQFITLIRAALNILELIHDYYSYGQTELPKDIHKILK